MAGDALILATSLNYWRYAQIGPPGSSIRPLSLMWTWRRRMTGDEFRVAGLWGELGRHRAAFVRDGQLRVAIGRHEWPVDDSLRCELTRDGRLTIFRLLLNKEVVARCEYRTPRPPYEAPFESPLDEEDYDFGAFIVHVIKRRSEEPSLESVWPFPRRLRRPSAA